MKDDYKDRCWICTGGPLYDEEECKKNPCVRTGSENAICRKSKNGVHGGRFVFLQLHRREELT